MQDSIKYKESFYLYKLYTAIHSIAFPSRTTSFCSLFLQVSIFILPSYLQSLSLLKMSLFCHLNPPNLHNFLK